MDEVNKELDMDDEQNIDCIKITIANFEKHFNKLVQNKAIAGEITHADTIICDDSIPAALRTLYGIIYSVEIIKPRTFTLFPLDEKELKTKRWIKCADVDGHLLYFDASHRNASGEFDIVNLENNYVVTKTLASFLTNKVWAYMERNRKIWAEENEL